MYSWEEVGLMGMRLASLVLTTTLAMIPTTAVAQQGAPHLTGAAGLSAVLPALMNAAYGGYTTVLYVENVSHPGQPAHVSIQYFDQNGTVTGTGDATPTAGIPFWGVWTVRQDNGHSFAAGAAGWGLVTSDQEVAIFVNEFAPGGTDGSGYTSIQMPAGGGTTLFAPSIANNAYGGYTTGIGLVNTSATPTTTTVTYSNTSGTTVKTQSVNLPAHGYAGLYSGDATLALPTGFTGTATISSSAGQVLAGIVNEVGPGGQFSSYDAVSAGATQLYAPAALNNAYGGYTTGMGVQNTTATAGSVTVTYYDGAGTSAASVTKAIAARGYLGIYQGGTDGPPASASGYTAVLTSTVTIAAIVNETAPGGAQSTSYNAETAGSGYLNLALVENAGADGWSTGLGIMNITNATINFSLVYFNAQTGAFISSTALSLPAHGYLGRYTPTDLPAGTRASAWLTSTTPGLAAICNEQGTGTLMSYNGQ
jgi:hypothetical protein